jgi:hypothetical protein
MTGANTIAVYRDKKHKPIKKPVNSLNLYPFSNADLYIKYTDVKNKV